MRLWLARPTLVLALTCSVVFLGACGSDSDEDVTSDSAEPSTDAGAESFALQPIELMQVPVPPGFSKLRGPVFLPDGEHVVVGAAPPGSDVGNQVVVSNIKTGQTECITCSSADPLLERNVGILNPFPDGERLFVGFQGVLECAPSLIDCQSVEFVPYDLPESAGVALQQGASPKLAPDGKHIGYSNANPDSLLEMVVAELVRESDRYVVRNPRVINPAGPSSSSDPSVENWSRGAALYELKTFVDGGASVTYVQAGGADFMNPDVWKVNLTTGERTRLTSHPDWDEDNAVSPDGELLAVFSHRTYNAFGWTGGLLPFRSFIDAALVGAMSSRINNAPNNFYCGGPMWLLPSTGDDGGQIAGQPIVDVVHDNSRITDHVGGWPMWSPDGTMIALQATAAPGGGVYANNTPPYLVVAELSAREPTEPLPVVSSEVGSWAPTPEEYEGTFAYSGEVTLDGPGGGNVRISYQPHPQLGLLQGTWSETYNDYSEDGETFINGTMTVHHIQPAFGELQYIADLTMSGANSGSLNGNITIFDGNAGKTSTGKITVTYNGTTRTGPPSWLDDSSGYCPPEQEPTFPKLNAEASRLNDNTYEVKVTASIAGVGPSESDVDTMPVKHARIASARDEVYTNDKGIAEIAIQGDANSPIQFEVTAGDTLAPTELVIEPAG